MRTPNLYAYRNHGSIDSDAEEVNDDDDDNCDDNIDLSFARNGNFINYEESKRHPKKRKLESFVSNYEIGPRREIWSEDESSVLLEAWGERFLQLGRRSLRADDWADVTEKIVEMGVSERTEAECRNQMDVLKKKYKKEMGKVESGQGSKWVFFKKMDGLLSTRNTRGHSSGLGCGVDSGEYVFLNPKVYLEMSNVLDEMRDSPGQSDEEDNNDGDERENEAESDGESTRVLAESIHKFGEIYEKIEESKRKQMMELEMMRQDFQRELELQKKQIVERAQAEIAKIREMDDGEDDDDDDDTSVGNSGD
ncbi:sequence-specific DNA binding transcription factors [Striga asiatica]|uniref:Sequence-specific DNA binding transcription factors n=1 Tax=Striga asiatica TaxID=4170 RepID=A0A5A7P0F3_STRAF|nr:sequence-specific DNA binding transcription factors [Striga asiatica]